MTLQAGDFLMAYDEERGSYPADFPFLPNEENTNLTYQWLAKVTPGGCST